jgi:putative phage-type endonuclease
MLTEKQLEKHNACITGSKVGAILGVSPFQSKYQLWAQMTGLVEREDFSSERMRMGNYAEAMTDEVVVGEKGWAVIGCKAEGLEHPDYPWMWGLIDRFRLDKNLIRDAILEYKNIDRMFLKDWDNDGVPAYHEAQCRLYSMIHDLPCILVVVFGGNTVRYYEIDRDKKIEAYILGECKKFWQSIQDMEAPEPDGSDSTGDALARLYPENSIVMLEGDQSIEDLIVDREKWRLVEAEAKARKSEAGNKIKAAISDNEGVMCPSGVKATWKLTKSSVKFDEKQFAEDDPECYNKYLVQKPGYRRLHINVKALKNQPAIEAKQQGEVE